MRCPAFKADTTINHGDSLETFIDPTFVTSYIVDKDYIRVEGTRSDILFKVKDNKTLSGEDLSRVSITKNKLHTTLDLSQWPAVVISLAFGLYRALVMANTV